MPTETDLARALHAFADDQAPDPAAFRAGLEHRLVVSDLGPARRHRPVVLLAAAACTLLLVGLGLVIAGDRRAPSGPTGTRSATVTSAPVTSAPGNLPLPDIGTLTGTRLVGSFAGTGPRTVTLPTYHVPARFELDSVFTCRGPGGFRLYTDDAGSFLTSQVCQAGSSGGSMPSTQRTLRVVVGATVRWRIAVAIAPKTYTNGGLQSPVDDQLLHDPLATGHGTRTLHVPAQSTAQVLVELTCTGSGVTLTSANRRFDGNYTRTCFSGHMYVFRVSKSGLPTAVTVHADAGTTWRIVVEDY